MCYKGYIIKIKGDKKATQNGKWPSMIPTVINLMHHFEVNAYTWITTLLNSHQSSKLAWISSIFQCKCKTDLIWLWKCTVLSLHTGKELW
jgi:hypothetical protein